MNSREKRVVLSPGASLFWQQAFSQCPTAIFPKVARAFRMVVFPDALAPYKARQGTILCRALGSQKIHSGDVL